MSEAGGPSRRCTASAAWQEYLFAANRKIAIAHYHLNQLRQELDAGSTEPLFAGQLAPIPVQAHFEGVLYAFIAACDQVAEGINLGLGLGWGRSYFDRAIRMVPTAAVRESLRHWNDAAITADVRAVRKLCTHHHYDKTPTGNGWIVDVANVNAYAGSRELVMYCTATVEHLNLLGPLIDEIGQLLAGLEAEQIQADGRYSGRKE